ncbi:hypothetical protein K439DRAFT_1636959 [Ramaria rubella]|nr:hypothetical protein K439DRAFT_1636959 [Ramaria rubella]
MFLHQCPANNRQEDDLCQGFIWCDTEATVVSPRTTTPCTGILCSMRPKPHPRHSKCVHQSCKEDCDALFASDGYVSVSCPAAGHYKTRPLAVSPFTIPPTPGATLASSPSTHSFSHSSHASASMSRLSTAGPYAQPLSPLYAAKLLQFEADDRAAIEHERIRLKDSRAEHCVLRVRWWKADGQPCATYRVQTGEHRKFLPSRCEEILNQAPNCTPFEYFDMDEREWVTTSLPLSVAHKDTLYLRTCGVTDCLGFGEFSDARHGCAPAG